MAEKYVSGVAGRCVYKDADCKVVSDAELDAAKADGWSTEPPLEHWYPHVTKKEHDEKSDKPKHHKK